MLPGFMPDASPVTGGLPAADAGTRAPGADSGSALPPVSSGQEAGVTPVQPTLDAASDNKQLIDGIHPTQDGCTKLGKAAFDLMVKEGMRR